MYGEFVLLSVNSLIKTKIVKSGLRQLGDLEGIEPEALSKLVKVPLKVAVDLHQEVCKLTETRQKGLINPDLRSVRVSTMIPELDQLLEGGLSTGGVHEISGLPGTGKTTLGLHCCFSVLNNRSLEGYGSIILDTEGSVSQRKMSLLGDYLVEGSGTSCNYADHIYYCRVTTHQQLETQLKQLKVIISQSTQVVFIDSISFLLSEIKNNQGPKKAGYISRLAFKLQKLAMKHNIAVIVTNKVYYVEDQRYSLLGATWSSLVNSKIAIEDNHCTVQNTSIRIQTNSFGMLEYKSELPNN